MRICWLCWVFLLCVPAHAERQVERIVVLAPSAARTVAALGRAASVVAVDEVSAALPTYRHLPIVARHDAVQLERLLALQPDVVLAWQSLTTERLADQLATFNIPVHVSRVDTMADIVADIATIGDVLSVNEATVAAVQRDFVDRITAVTAQYADAAPLSVMYVLWPSPLMVIGDMPWINELFAACGGRNVFADAAVRTPQLGAEHVIAAAPQVVVVAADSDVAAAQRHWRRLLGEGAVVVATDADALLQPSPLLATAAADVCAALAAARK